MSPSSSAFWLVSMVPALLLYFALSLKAPKRAWWLLVVLIPWTVTVELGATVLERELAIGLPLEPLAVVFLLAFCLRNLFPRLFRTPVTTSSRNAARLMLHPLSVAVLMQALWVSLSTVSSAEPVVSVKYLLVRLLVIVVFFIAAVEHLSPEQFEPRFDRTRDSCLGLKRFTLVAAASWVPVALWALARHAANGFSRIDTYAIARPLVHSHLEYGSALVLVALLLIAITLSEQSTPEQSTPEQSSFAFSWRTGWRVLAIVVLLVAIADAYARSVWLALAVGMLFTPLVAVRPRPKVAALGLAVLALMFAASVQQVLSFKSRIQQNVPQTIAFEGSVRSLLDGPAFRDSSLIERLNRWSAAGRLARERPGLGVGPGAFERHYGPYQVREEMTRYSTWDGERGDAHSEFVTAFVELGVPGLFLHLWLFGVALWVAFDIAWRGGRRELFVGAGLVAALVSLLVVSVFHGFLEFEEVASSFWVVCAACVLAHDSLKS